jgi:thymidine kinase
MSLELILGPMFSGKSSAILARLRRAEVLKMPTLVLTSALDKRYTESAEVVTHNLQRIDAVAVTRLSEAMGTDLYLEAKLIVIEEAQFFPDLKEFVLRAVDSDSKNVVVVGLDGDSRRQAFGQIPELLPNADKIEKLTALCARCGDWTPAIFTHRKTAFETQVAVGDTSMYEPLCRRHWRELNSE